ncbi:hypothetical protein [Streptococcus loxodontisalivarius]|uniref:Uncharacterized protein n=1 Tax=Streptococcus loxodontisalivarius TaxID=1349415 RepID=A0ABS2PRM4_9STRE|nr:hypothetical protein [Streptococcus loxodontisalivarius]MBM7642037.1 hypothetical protein [Streptococcus loxodontisalivarius]
MKTVRLCDLKRMGQQGGYTIKLKRHFPIHLGIGKLKRDGIEFERLVFFDGKPRRVTIKEPYSHELLYAIASIKCQKVEVAYRRSQGNLLVLTGKGYHHVL